MTTAESKLDQQYTIAITLDEDPAINFFAWKLSVEDVASGAATLITPTGLLTTIMTDAEWDAYPVNITPHGITARPIEPNHAAIIAAMTGPTIAVHAYGNKKHEMWHKAKEQFKAALIRSLGPTLSATIAPPPIGFKMMSLLDIMTRVAAKYATVDVTALDRMEAIMNTPMDHVTNLEPHLAKLTRHINMHVAAGFDIEEYRRVKFFRQSVQHHPQIAKTLESFDEEFPNPKAHTYALITDHVQRQLPPILSAAMTGKAFHVDTSQTHAETTT